MAHKTFTKGQAVEVWIQLFGCWLRGVYERPSGTPGVHLITLGGEIMEFSTRNVRAIKATP